MMIFNMDFDLLVTFQRKSKYDKRVDSHCFRCQRLNEDFNHVLAKLLIGRVAMAKALETIMEDYFQGCWIIPRGGANLLKISDNDSTW